MNSDEFLQINPKYINQLWRIEANFEWTFLYGSIVDVERYIKTKVKNFLIQKVEIADLIMLIQTWSPQFIDVNRAYSCGETLPNVGENVKYNGAICKVISVSEQKEILIESLRYGQQFINENSIFEII